MTEQQSFNMQLRFLEFICGAVSYRRASTVSMRFGTGWNKHIPHEWYIMRKGTIRLTIVGWRELLRLTPTVRTAHNDMWTLQRDGRIRKEGKKYYWVMPSYLLGRVA